MRFQKVSVLRSKGLGVATAHAFEDEPSSMVHEQLARLKFAESHISMRQKRILDFGCGTGYNSFYISERQSPDLIVGLDILEDAIAYCKKYYLTPRIEYYVQDCLIHNPKFGLFDVVISCEVIEHVADQELFVDVLTRYLRPGGIAYISTPNKALFGLTKDRPFVNPTHIKELYFDEFRELLARKFREYRIYSMVHKERWHSAYINSLCAANLVWALRYEIFNDSIIGKVAATIGKVCLYAPLLKIKSQNYPDVRKRRYTDFDFVPGCNSRAVWFVAVCYNSM